jgi:hypothetical protein
MSKSRFPVTFLKGALGLCLAVLLIAPVAALWSGTEGRPGVGGRQAAQMQSGEGIDMPAWWMEEEVAWIQKNRKRAYSRGEDFWPAEMGKRQLGSVDLAESRSPYVVHLPGSKGSFDTRNGAPIVPAGLMKAKDGPVRAQGNYFIVQPKVDFLRGKTSADVREMIASLGEVEILERVPNNAFLLRVKGQKTQQSLLSSANFQFVEPYQPAFKIDRRVGRTPLLSSERAASNTLNLIVRSHRGVSPADFRQDVEKIGGNVVASVEANGRIVLGVDINRTDIFKLAKVDDIYRITEKPDYSGLMQVTSSQVEMGRFLDPRQNGGFVRPFFDAGIDGGGEYATDPNDPGLPVGCNAALVPFNPATGTVDPDCYYVQPQFVGLMDNGISLDSAPLAHSTTQPCVGACGTAQQITGVGDTHRKVEMYVRSRDLNNDGVLEDGTAEGDALSCDAMTSGGGTHGHVVASVMLGNSTNGQFGIGVTWDNTNASNIFTTFFNDTNERQIPADGQAPGARLLFIDGRGVGVSVGGPPPCATDYKSDVDPGVSVLDDVEALAYRRDLNIANSTLHPRGAKIIALPFGYTVPFNTDLDDGHGTYVDGADDLDEFLFNNRRVLIAVASGNDGADESSGADVDPFNDFEDPNVGFSVADLQIQDLATGKNTTIVGMNQTDGLNLSGSPTDRTEFMINLSSKGPATFNSLRIAPEVVGPGWETSAAGGGREGQFFADYGDSIFALQSFDDEQDTSEGIEAVRHHKWSGSSFATGKIAGAAAQIRDYFAKGYYLNGEANAADRVSDISGVLVNALLVASADGLTSGPRIASCASLPCIEMGWGKVELANILPLDTYSDTRRRPDVSNSPLAPTVPRNLLVADEYFDGGLGIGVIAPGQIKEYEFSVDHTGSSIIAVLHWYDAEGELLVNDLDLEMIDGDYDRTAGWDTYFGYPGPGSGMCNAFTGGYYPDTCGNCLITGLDNPDPNYFDVNGTNPWIRRFIGNVMTDRGNFSQHAECDPNTGVLDSGDPSSQYDRTNNMEKIHIYSFNNYGTGPTSVTRGSASEGFYKAIVRWDTLSGSEVGAPNAPCVSGGTDGVISTPLGGNDSVLTANGKQYIGSGTDNLGTPGVDEAACAAYSGTLAGDDVQLVPDNSIAQPFALVLAGALAHPSLESLSSISLNKEAYDCSDRALTVSVVHDETDALANRTANSRAGTVIEVLDENGAVVDSEGGFTFTQGTGTTGQFMFKVYERMFNISEQIRVQSIQNQNRNPVQNNGMVEVRNGYTIRATFSDPTEIGDVVHTSAEVNCSPKITPGYALLAIENKKQKFISGGCDLGRTIALRGDFNLDAGERVQYQVHFNNHGNDVLRNVKATLSCDNGAAGNPGNNPCQYLDIVDPVQTIGDIPFGRESAATWNIDVDEAVVALAAADRVVFLDVDFDVDSTDDGGTITTQGFRFREALHADNDIRFWSTDYPTGGKKFIDMNLNGLVDTAEFNNGGRREGREIRTYETWSGTPNFPLANTVGGLCTGGCIPWNFDKNSGGFGASLASDSLPGAGYPTGTQGWAYGTGGGCGWQTQGASGGAAAPKGVWHAGDVAGPANLVGGGCGTYVLPSDASDGDNNNFVTYLLVSPAFQKVQTTPNARGFTGDVRVEHLSWNANEQMTDAAAGIIIEIDMQLPNPTGDPNNPERFDGGITILGDSYSYRPTTSVFGPRTGASNSAARFGPTFDSTPGSFPSGDEVGIATPLANYDVGNFVTRPFMPFPAADDDAVTTGFQSDTGIQNGANFCGDLTIPVGAPCRRAGFTTPEGPVRNRFLETGASYEDFWGDSGERFAFEFSWQVNEGGAAAAGYTIDDMLFEWSEQRPEDQVGFSGGDCTLNNLSFACTANLCVGGPRNGLSCGSATDCRDVVAEGDCAGSTCVNGLVGKTCSVDNDCDLGRCVAGNTDLGCEVDTDCNRATNDCDAIPYRISALNAGLGSAYTARQCATISMSKEYTYACTGSMNVTVQDDTPLVSGTIAGTCAASLCTTGHVGDACSSNPQCDVRQVTVNVRTPAAGEPLGESFVLNETANGSGVFSGDVAFTSLQNLPGTLFVDGNPGVNVNIFGSYNDPECDQDRDGETGETPFEDIDGDGVANFGGDGILGDQDPALTTVEGEPTSDDDSCYNSGNATDFYNPAGQAQIDLNGDGRINSSDCVVDPNHNENGQCDWDSDGVGDVCDNCPAVANGSQVDTDGDGVGNGCEITDIDGDGVDNTVDNCPTVGNVNDQTTGDFCDDTNDADADGVINTLDNCPTATATGNPDQEEDPNGNLQDHDCNPTDGYALCYNPDQRDQDQDGVGDVCDREDLDGDGVQNVLDNCATVYNPADPAFQVQADSDGDGFGDDLSASDSVGTCVNGSDPNFDGLLCNQIGALGGSCGSGGSCVQSGDPYCDYDSDDDNSDGAPDDLVVFTTEINCNYNPSHFGAPTAEIAAIGLAGVTLTDDGGADWICVSGDPNPNNNPATPEACPEVDANGNILYQAPPNQNEVVAEGDAGLRAAALGVSNSTLDNRCDTTLGSGDGDCEPVMDLIIDPGELASVQLSLSNQTLTATGGPRTLTNTEVGLLTSSAEVGCLVKGQTFVGTFPGGGVINTPPGGLQFILDPATAISTPVKFTTAAFTVTVRADAIQGNNIPQNFSLVGDSDQVAFPPIASNCGLGAGLDPAHGALGVLCEDFDTDRNGSGFEGDFIRLPVSVSPTDPLLAFGSSTDDILGYTVGGGPTPTGVSGQQCSDDAGFPAAAADCWVVPGENDWHLHTPNEGCDNDDSYDLGVAGFDTTCAPDGGKSHSGVRSMHMGRHLDATTTHFDTYRLRQTSAFVMDPVALGSSSLLEFWHIIRVCDDQCTNPGDGATTAGGQVHISLYNSGTGLYQRWERLSATQNGYGSLDNDRIVICDFDPGDDLFPPANETMCFGGISPLYAEVGDVYGADRGCVNDTDGGASPNGDCGETSNRTVAACDWVTTPSCGSFLELGAGQQGTGAGVWGRSQFDLSAYSGRQARLRWVFQGGGGWGFGESRSFLEPEPGGAPYFAYDDDDGWYIDDIKLTDLRTSPAIIQPDPIDGLAVCPVQGNTDNCGVVSIAVSGSAVDALSGQTVVHVADQVSGTSFVLDARQSTAGDDPGTVGTLEGACSGGVLEFQWTNLATGEVLKPFSPGGEVRVSQDYDTSYLVEARCSSDRACAASRTVLARSYPGDGGDLLPSYVASGQGFVPNPLVGLSASECVGGNVTLTWNARPQPSGTLGYDVFECIATVNGTCTGGGPGAPKFFGTCASADVAAGTVGQSRSVTRTCPAPGTAKLWAVGHSTRVAGYAGAPLGDDPVSGEIVLSTVSCP